MEQVVDVNFTLHVEGGVLGVLGGFDEVVTDWLVFCILVLQEVVPDHYKRSGKKGLSQ